MNVSGAVAHELVGSALLIAAAVLVLIAWYILRSERRAIGTWNILVRRKPRLGRALAVFMAHDAAIYFVIGLAVIRGSDPIGLFGFTLAMSFAVSSAVLFIVWAREEWT